MGGVGIAAGKLILFGEHAAVHGYPAVGVSLAERTMVRLKDNAGTDWDLSEVPAGDRETIHRVLRRLEELVPEISTRTGCKVTVSSDVPRGVGFGSSAALCAALARAALAHAGEAESAHMPGSARVPGNPHRAWELAHDTEKLFHGTPSGIDTGLAVLDGVFAFAPRPPALPQYQPLPSAPLHLVVAAVPRSESCGALVAMLGERMKAGHQETLEAIQDLGRIAGAARDMLAASAGNYVEQIAALAEKAMRRLRGLGLSSPWLDGLLGAGRKAGALGGKLSGAGGGGAFFLVTRDRAGALEVASSVEEAAAAAGITLAAPVRLLTTS